MCILLELDMILKALPRARYVRFNALPPFSAPVFSSHVFAEQTETELRLLVQNPVIVLLMFLLGITGM